MPQDTLYTRVCNVPGSGYVICPNVGWFRDFTDPQSVLEPTFKGAAIKPQGVMNGYTTTWDLAFSSLR